MRLEELILFRRAAALGGLSAAGRELGLSPAAASARLQSLEKSLGAALFQRTTRRLSLTEEGETLLAHAERALDELDAARDALRGGRETPRGRLRATVPAPFGQKHVLPHVRTFLERYPEIEIDLNMTDDIVNLSEGGYELAIRIGPVSDSALRATKLAANRRMLIASPDYVARAGAPETPDDLVRHACLMQGAQRVWTLRRLDGAGAPVSVRVSGPLHANSGAVVRDAALFGLGIGLKSQWDTYEDLAAGRLVRVLPDWEPEGAGAIWALRPPSRFASPRARAFIEHIKSVYGPTPIWEREAGD